MQNKWKASDEAGFVALNGGWVCRRCGCANEGCDVCTRCGWNMSQGCGCQGGVVAAETTATRQTGAGWSCTRCGCVNENCNICTRCGWVAERNCGCQGGAVAAETITARQTACGCEADQGRQRRCSACPAEGGTAHTVQCCPSNTSLRPRLTEAAELRCGCASAANTAGRCGRAVCENAVSPANAVRQYDCPVAAGVGMVYAVKQELGDVYQPESALRTGTLFPELHKPMNGRCPGSCNMSTTGQQSAFSAWDLRLYLDTHPDDADARALFGHLAREAEEPCYATTFLTGGPGWGWTDEPWPWECRDNNA